MNRRLVSLLTASVVLLSACAVAADGPSPTLPPVTITEASIAPTTTTLPVEVALTRFRECLTNQGLEIEEILLDARGRPRFDLMFIGVDFSDPASVDALAFCRGLVVGSSLDLSDSPELRSEVIALLGEFAACVRERGVENFPDPAPNFDGTGSPFATEEIPYDDPDLASAVEICRTRLVPPSS